MADQEFALDLQRLESCCARSAFRSSTSCAPGPPKDKVASRLAGAGFAVTDDLLPGSVGTTGPTSTDGEASRFSTPFRSTALRRRIAWAQGEAAEDLLLEELDGWAPFSYVPLFAEDKTKTLGVAFNVGDRHTVRLGWYDAPGYVEHGSLHDFVRRLTDAYAADAHYYNLLVAAHRIRPGVAGPVLP